MVHRSEIFQIARDWDKFEHEGSIGGCFLRDCAQRYIQQFPRGVKLPIVSAMRDLAFEAYRALARDAWGPEKFE
jgi:hypothetical protein